MKDVPRRQCNFNYVDGDGDETVLIVRLDSALNLEGKLLMPRAVTWFKSCFPERASYGDLRDMMRAIALHEF